MSFELPLPVVVPEADGREDSEAAAYLRQLLARAVPRAEIVAIARRPGVQSKVAVRAGSIAGDVLTRLREELGGERIEVVRYSVEPRQYIAAALGLQEPAPTVLKPHINHAEVLVGEIDQRGLNGWRGVNRLLASALTGWRIHLRAISDTRAWRTLERAKAERRPIWATVLAERQRGAILEVHGLHARMRDGGGLTPGAELQVRITKMDADEGKILVTRRLGRSNQLPLPNN